MKWENPYKGDKSPQQRVSANIPREDIELIYSVLLEHGALVKIVTLAMKRTVDIIRQNGYTVADRDKLIAQIVGGDDGRGVKEVRRGTTKGKKVKHKSVCEETDEHSKTT